MESTLSHGCSGPCSIIPLKLLEYLARDERLSTAERRIFFDTAQFERRWRKARAAETRLTLAAQAKLPSALTAAPSDLPAVAVFDCRHGTKLPGTPVPDPNQTEDAAARQAFVETTAVAEFYKTLFGRNSIDNAGIAIISSVHYSVKYNNAFWNGNQMVYGDGDGNIFLNFTKSDDVIGHELTHGVTQHSLGLSYVNQAGGLNESISDVFGAMFRQWRAGLDVTSASWLIGSDIMGPGATARGFTCLRDMSNPAAEHCLAPQPTHFSAYHDGMDPHESSGIPNFAFYKAAMAIGGNSWDRAGRVWYQALTGFAPRPYMKMSTFANRTRALAGRIFPSEPAVQTAIDAAWTAVGL